VIALKGNSEATGTRVLKEKVRLYAANTKKSSVAGEKEEKRLPRGGARAKEQEFIDPLENDSPFRVEQGRKKEGCYLSEMMSQEKKGEKRLSR